MTPRIGSVCTGYGGLDMAVQQVLGGHLAWVADPDPGAAAILAHHHPDVPNLGDITVTDWAAVEPVDVVCGGYPCQPFSVAGLRKGTADERHIWPYIATALRVLRPQLAVFENVANHLRIGFDQVLRDLAALGFDAEWCTVRASEVGAPHQRNRLFIVAVAQDADGAARDQWRLAAPGQAESRGARADARGRGGASAADTACRAGSVGDGDGAATADAGRAGLEGGRTRRAVAQRLGSAADSPGIGRGEGRPEPAGQQGGLGAAGGRGATPADADRSGLTGHRELPAGRDTLRVGLRDDADGQRPPAATDADGGVQRPLLDELRPGKPDAAWGAFLPAIRRWEHATGRRAPRATDARNRLSPLFVEWLMGLPAGHVTHVPDLTRTQQLKALGNGVVPQQAAAALRLLLNRAEVAA